MVIPLETGKKASANKCYISDNVCLLCLSYNVKKPKTTAKLSKKSRNKRRSNRFYNVLRDIHVYTVTISYRHST
jgi:hypothetical protein